VPGRYRRLERRAARAAWAALGAPTEISGLEHASGGPFVILSLHESLVDPLLLAHLPLPMVYAARDELWDWPSVGPMLRAGRHLYVPTDSTGGVGMARSLLSGAQGAIQRGESVVVFPQGSVLGIEIAFERGAFWLARALGVPVLPVALWGTHRTCEYPFSPRLRRRQPARLHVLPPVAADEAYRRRVSIEREMRRLAMADPRVPPRRFVPERDGYWDGYPFRIAPEFAGLARDIEEHRRR
jgi:1-acyl-sn-glycerol-3-phosphate acyltransferase